MFFQAAFKVWGWNSSLFPFDKAAGSPHRGYTYIYRRLLYWSYTEGKRVHITQTSKNNTDVASPPGLRNQQRAREREREREKGVRGSIGETAQEKGERDGRWSRWWWWRRRRRRWGDDAVWQLLNHLPNNLTLEKNIQVSRTVHLK